MTFKKASFALQGRWLRALSEEDGGIVWQLHRETLLVAKNSTCFNVKTNQNTLFPVCKDFFSLNACFSLTNRPFCDNLYKHWFFNVSRPDWRNTQVAIRGPPAKGLVRGLPEARVRISLSPPNKRLSYNRQSFILRRNEIGTHFCDLSNVFFSIPFPQNTWFFCDLKRKYLYLLTKFLCGCIIWRVRRFN